MDNEISDRFELQSKQSAADERDFSKVASGGMAVGFACLGAAIQSLRSGGAGFYFTFSFATLLAALIGAIFSLVCWKLMMLGRWPARLVIALMGLTAAGSFLYPLRFVRPELRWQIAQGLLAAVCAIALGATMLFRLARFFQKDAEGATDA